MVISLEVVESTKIDCCVPSVGKNLSLEMIFACSIGQRLEGEKCQLPYNVGPHVSYSFMQTFLVP